MYVICVAEHLCRQYCECYNVSLLDVINEVSVQQKRQQLLKLIFDLAKQDNFASWCVLSCVNAVGMVFYTTYGKMLHQVLDKFIFFVRIELDIFSQRVWFSVLI